MRFWDTSALAALLAKEKDSSRRVIQLREDPALAVWWTTIVECESAIQLRIREGTMETSEARTIRERLAELSNAWREVPPTPALRTLGTRLIRTHPLGAADALQLAAALSLATALRF